MSAYDSPITSDSAASVPSANEPRTIIVQEISLRTTGRELFPISIEAFFHPKVPHIAAHVPLSEFSHMPWSLTHVPSGYSLNLAFGKNGLDPVDSLWDLLSIIKAWADICADQWVVIGSGDPASDEFFHGFQTVRQSLKSGFAAAYRSVIPEASGASASEPAPPSPSVTYQTQNKGE